MNNLKKQIKMLETFLSEREVEGVCGYIVDSVSGDMLQVIVVLDINYIKEANTKPGFVAKMIREGVKNEIKTWLNLNAFVGSIAKECTDSEPITESKKKTYIITESQYELLIESREMNWFKRRANKESMKKYITNAEINFPTLCDDFGDEFDYADNVIKWAVDEFMTINEDMFLDDKFDEFNETLVNMCKEWFGEYLFEIYRNTCSEENGY